MPSHDTAIVFLAHAWDEAMARRFERLHRESAPHADCFLLLQDDGGEVRARWQAFLTGISALDAFQPFNVHALPQVLGYNFFGSNGVMSNTHFPLMQFARSQPEYSKFWQVEYDVELRGSWSDFFAARNDSDASLLAAHFHTYLDCPDWMWWFSVTSPPGLMLQPPQYTKAFMPVMRLSRGAIDSLERAHRAGWLGHFETVIPTVLLLEGHKLEDLNARGTCYIGWMQDPCQLLALQSTLRCRPFVALGEFAQRGEGALFFHPVKERWFYDGKQVVVPPA